MRTDIELLKGLNPTVTIASKILVVGFVIFCALHGYPAAAQSGKWSVVP